MRSLSPQDSPPNEPSTPPWSPSVRGYTPKPVSEGDVDLEDDNIEEIAAPTDIELHAEHHRTPDEEPILYSAHSPSPSSAPIPAQGPKKSRILSSSFSRDDSAVSSLIEFGSSAAFSPPNLPKRKVPHPAIARHTDSSSTDIPRVLAPNSDTSGTQSQSQPHLLSQPDSKSMPPPQSNSLQKTRPPSPSRGSPLGIVEDSTDRMDDKRRLRQRTSRFNKGRDSKLMSDDFEPKSSASDRSSSSEQVNDDLVNESIIAQPAVSQLPENGHVEEEVSVPKMPPETWEAANAQNFGKPSHAHISQSTAPDSQIVDLDEDDAQTDEMLFGPYSQDSKADEAASSFLAQSGRVSSFEPSAPFKALVSRRSEVQINTDTSRPASGFGNSQPVEHDAKAWSAPSFLQSAKAKGKRKAEALEVYDNAPPVSSHPHLANKTLHLGSDLTQRTTDKHLGPGNMSSTRSSREVGTGSTSKDSTGELQSAESRSTAHLVDRALDNEGKAKRRKLDPQCILSEAPGQALV